MATGGGRGSEARTPALANLLLDAKGTDRDPTSHLAHTCTPSLTPQHTLDLRPSR